MVLFFNGINFETISILSEKKSKQVTHMADEDLLDVDDEMDSDIDEEMDSDFDEIKAPPKKKRSKLKWILYLLILIILAVAVTVGLERFGYIDLPINDYIPVEKLFEGSDSAIKVEPESAITQTLLPPAPDLQLDKDMEEEAERARSERMKGNYLLKIGSCIDKTCRKELENRIKHLNLPMVTRESTQSTTYYEILSNSSYLKKRAEEKLRLVNKYNETIGFPYLLPTRNGRYVISFGQFPQEAGAVQMKSQLEHLYSQIRLRFNVRPRKDSVKITGYYLGPYNKATAEKERQRLRETPDFEWIEITKRN